MRVDSPLDCGSKGPAEQRRIISFISDATLTDAEGQPLIDQVQAIIDQLNGNPLPPSGGSGDDAENFTNEQLWRNADRAIELWVATSLADDPWTVLCEPFEDVLHFRS